MRYRLIYHVVVAVLLGGSWFAGYAQTEPAAESEVDGKRVFVLRVEGMISDVILTSLERRVEEAREEGVDLIVLEMDTYGGLVISALEICRYIKNLDIDTLAWVNDKAYSAGAMISLACDDLVMSPRSSIGDSAPIAMGQSMEETERAKAESPILEEFRDSAHRNGYPEVLCEAMVRLGPAVYMIERVSEGPGASAEETGGGEAETGGAVRYVWATQLPAYGLEATPGDRGGAESGDDDLGETLRRAFRSATGGGSEEAEPEDDPGPQSGEWRIVERVNPADTLLTLTQDEAVEHGFARRIIADETALAAYTGAAEGGMTRLEITWSEHLTNWLTSPQVRAVLMLLLMLGGYMELQSPGLGLGGAVALTALVVLVGAPYLAGMAGVFDVILILLGIGLITVEVFVLPGFGIAGFLGLVSLFAGFLMTFVQEEPGDGWLPTLPGTWEMVQEGMAAMVVSLLLAFVGAYFLTKYFGSIPILNRMILQTRQVSQGMPAPVSGGPVTEDEPAAEEVGPRVGDTGRTLTELRPTGRAEFDGEVADVVTYGGWVEVDREVRVAEVHGNRIVVEEV